MQRLVVGHEEREAVVSPERAGAVLCARRLVFWEGPRGCVCVSQVCGLW